MAAKTERAGSQPNLSPGVEDAAARGEYHFLDVGDERYGECILVVFGKVRILIDGSHRADMRSRNGRPSVPDQLAEILNEPAPHRITLVVVTHGHADHIGCLPELLSTGVIAPEWALITDRKLGFGRTLDDDSDVSDLASDPRARLAAVWREEDASDLDDAALSEFIDTVTSVESRYAEFIENLESAGVTVVEHRGDLKLPKKLAEILKPTGASLLGPSEDQLLLCAQQIATTNQDAFELADALMRVDASIDDVRLYRAAVANVDRLSDSSRNPRGSGMNCQSITFAFGPRNARVLLAGDMQFTAPGVKGVDKEMQALRDRVIAAGPYIVFKTTHHTSDNGQDDELLTQLGDPPIIVHSGGRNDSGHPDKEVLELLEARRAGIKFARTDRNGRITVRPQLELKEAIETRGRINNFTVNPKSSDEPPTPAAPTPAAIVQATVQGAGPQIVIVNLPPGPIDMTVAGVEIQVRHGANDRSAASAFPSKSPGGTPGGTGGLPTIARSSLRRPVVLGSSVSLGGGRELPDLLFVTNKRRLENGIGKTEAGAALDAVLAAKQKVVEVGDDPVEAAKAVSSLLARDSTYKGVVILGGYDVVPSQIVDVLEPAVRRSLGSDIGDVDEDHFIVWSDEAYGDTDGDHIGELPVSRIPDARDARMFHRALSSRGVNPSKLQRFGVRNLARPFAADVWPALAGSTPLNVSASFLHTDANPQDLETAQLHYLMLHGSWRDGWMFLGEKKDRTYTDAFFATAVPQQFDGLAFAGCCWGALTVSQRARDAGSATQIAPRVVERSIALSYLNAGGNAFVGCTGAHYSGPDTDPDVNYATHMHRAFWKALPVTRYSAASALHAARTEYSADIATRAGDMETLDLARRLKNRAQFTCLGLGW
ncbi:MBL fold metallo-hydrolase [Piscinibacter sp. HJYY11]|uniref:MBL fold metallo-hydrolase n=1 Tax=Piscinibacter sp. HJYY11 TaxID=2801333 RepID=UPI00191E83B7|nr:MBL fold metallo-hydrolase [Piscinibacter sp. HJYY11]MBL0729677.1 MBL fold metallo-hydrolase [Piscinibacter sp. HJYY11]